MIPKTTASEQRSGAPDAEDISSSSILVRSLLFLFPLFDLFLHGCRRHDRDRGVVLPGLVVPGGEPGR